MNFRLAISTFPAANEASRARLVAAIAEAAGVDPADLLARIDSTPAWLIELPDRDEAEAWRALLDRQRGVSVALMPALGPPVASQRAALDRLRALLDPGARGPRGLARVADARARLSPPPPAHPPVAEPAPPSAVRRRGITAPVAFINDATEPEVEAIAIQPARPAAPSRGITAPVDFLSGAALARPSGSAGGGLGPLPGPSDALGPLPGLDALGPLPPADGGGDPPAASPAFYNPALAAAPAPPPERREVHEVRPDGRDTIDYERRRRARGQGPTVAPAGQQRRAIDVRETAGQRFLGPLARVAIPALLIVVGVFVWRALQREVVNKPAVDASLEVLDEGRAPRAPLRYTPAAEAESFRVALGLDHRFTDRKIDVRRSIETIGGSATLTYEAVADDHFDVQPRGREARLGVLVLSPIRVLDIGHTGPVPAPTRFDVEPDEKPAMLAFGRLIRPPYVLLPPVPVGIGARWRYILDAEQSPLGMPVEVALELLARDEERVELAVRLTVPAGRDPGDTPLAYQAFGPFRPRYDPPVRIFDLAGSGDGRATLSLDRLTPVALDVEVRFNARLEVRSDFGEQLIAYRPTISLEIQSD
ncbi:MAG: hypothetical protein R3F65_09725 [bacterium]